MNKYKFLYNKIEIGKIGKIENDIINYVPLRNNAHYTMVQQLKKQGSCNVTLQNEGKIEKLKITKIETPGKATYEKTNK